MTIAGEFDAAKIWLSRIPRNLPRDGGPLPDGFASVASIRAMVLAHPMHSVSSSLLAAREMLALEPLGSTFHSAARIVTGMNLYLAGHLAEARTHLEAARVESTTAPRTMAEMLSLTYLSLVEHDVGDPAAADELALEAARLMDAADVVDYPVLAPLYVVSASAFARSGDRERAEHDLAEGARLAAIYGRSIIPALTMLLSARLRLSWGDVDACRVLLREAHGSLEACADAGVLREVFAGLDARTRPRGTRASVPEALTTSEVAVLRLLATDLSLGEIAARLFVSINTIKTHTRHIYRKLKSPSRSAAVERGRSLDLI